MSPNFCPIRTSSTYFSPSLKNYPTDSDFDEIAVSSLKCEGGHPSGKSLVKRFFNCFAKNWVKRLSGDCTCGRDMKI